MKRFLFLVFIFLFSYNFASAQQEGDLSLSPKVIDDSATPRAMLEYNLKLKNNTDHKLNIYPILEDLEKNKKIDTEGLLERQYKMTKWMSIKRGAVMIMPRGEISLPLKIDISQDAIPGDYFVSITLANGSNKPEAQNNAIKESPPKLFVNLIVEDQTVEKASVLKFYPQKNIFINPIPKLLVDLNNSGNVDLIPTGRVVIYNKKNQEVDAVDINTNFATVSAGKVFTFELNGNNKLKTGKYKARLLINYGDKTAKEIQDTIYFLIISLPFLLFFGIVILSFIVLLSRLIFKKTYYHKNIDSNNNHRKNIVIKNENKKEDIINLKSD